MSPRDYVGWWASTFCRGLLIVGLVSLNTRWIAKGQYIGAGPTAFAISWVWWTNARSAGRVDVRGCRAAYALGGACGTLLGMWMGA